VPTPASLLHLQRTAGNAAVARMLQRATLPGPAASATDPAGAPACDPAAEQAVTEFMSREYPAKLIRPNTDTATGWFDAEYTPADGILNITVRVAFNFVDGDRSDSMWIASVGGPDKAAQYANDQFKWKPEEQAEWKENATAKVRDIWSGRYRFHIQRPCWERLPPVDVAISIVPQAQMVRQGSGTAVGPGAGGPHKVFWIRKYPTEPRGRRDGFSGGWELNLYEQGAEGITNPDRTQHSVGTDRESRYKKVDESNPRSINFALNEHEVTSEQKTALRKFGATLARPELPAFPITVTGHASSDGPEQANLTLSERRARNVGKEIVGAKTEPRAIGVGEKDAEPTPDWRFVDITVGKFESDQLTIAHEFGHMFGLGDEYPEEDRGRPPGAATSHSKLVKDVMDKEILARHDDSIMSVGEVVRPHHYVVFLDALVQLTSPTTNGRDWDVRPAPGRGPDDVAPPVSQDPAVCR
jgi:outer membrane protein OmpA-like peptidoglycan-associated protein